MRVRITGQLIDVREEQIVLERDGVAYELLVPRFAITTLAAQKGNTVTLHTFEYLEGSLGGGNLIPRLVGFLDTRDREFFHRFTDVKGMGIRKTLRAMVDPVARLARDIEAADAKALTRLPGIGARAAQTLIAELRGKLTEYAMDGTTGAGVAGAQAPRELAPAQRDALDLMVAWGDARADAERWLARVAQSETPPESVEDWVRAAYRIKTGGPQ